MRERPKAIWHPVPVSEIWIALGLIGVMVGLLRGGAASAARPLVLGFAVLALGVLEVAAREHVTGFRRHTALLAFLISAVIHGALVLWLPVRLIGAGALAVDLVVFAAACGVLDAVWRCRTAGPNPTPGGASDA
jgi:hypothetical protein